MLALLMRSPTRARRRIAASWLACLCVLALSPLCLAEPSAAQKEMARTLVGDGDRLFAAGDYQAALQRYRGAFELVRAPTVEVEIVKAQAALELLLEAKATAIQILSAAAEPGEPAVFAEARATAEQMAEILEARIPQILIRLSPGTATRVEVDAQTIPPDMLQLPLRLNPGAHALRVSAPGHHAFDTRFNLKAAERKEIVVQLVALESSTPASSSARAEESGLAQVDPARTRGIIALGVAGVGAAVGATMGVLAFTSERAVERDYCDANGICDPAGSSDARRSKTYGTVANVSFAIAGAAGLYAAWELLFDTSNAREAAAGSLVRVAGTARPGELQLGLVGEF